MPRGSTVRYYFDSVTASVIAVTREGVRVLREITPGIGTSPRKGKRRGRPPGSKNKKTQATAEGHSTTTPKRRGRPRKATS